MKNLLLVKYVIVVVNNVPLIGDLSISIELGTLYTSQIEWEPTTHVAYKRPIGLEIAIYWEIEIGEGGRVQGLAQGGGSQILKFFEPFSIYFFYS